jgi:hypothetical protein
MGMEFNTNQYPIIAEVMNTLKPSALSDKLRLIRSIFKDVAIQCRNRNKPDDSQLFLNQLEVLCQATLEFEKFEIKSLFLKKVINEGIKKEIDSLKALRASLIERHMIYLD